MTIFGLRISPRRILVGLHRSGLEIRSVRAHPQAAFVSGDEAQRSEVEIRRSARRKRTVSAYRDGERIVVLVPARLGRSDEQRLVAELVERILARERRAVSGGARASDAALTRRARELSGRYLPGGPAPASVRWVTGMRTRWASCTPVDGTIRMSDRLRSAPSWVLDYVLVHELAHLQVPGHGARFWALVASYPQTERARGYLDGLSAGLAQRGVPAPASLDDDQDGDT